MERNGALNHLDQLAAEIDNGNLIHSEKEGPEDIRSGKEGISDPGIALGIMTRDGLDEGEGLVEDGDCKAEFHADRG